MKLKGINPFEQHIEKLVFGLMLAFALGMLVLQFTGSNTIDLEGKEVRPEQVPDTLTDKAQGVKSRLESTRVDDSISQYEKIDIKSDFERQKREGIVVADATTFRLGESEFVDSAGTLDGPIAPPEDARYATFEPAQPMNALAYAFDGTIDPIVVQQVIAEDPAAAEFFPDQQPFDKRAASVSVTLSASDIRSALAAIPDDPQEIRIRDSWWRDDLMILATELEREEMLADGTWGNATTVPTLPGRIDLRSQFQSSDFMARMLPNLLSDAESNQLEIRRPDYYPMISGNNWIWPEAGLAIYAEDADNDTAKRDRLIREWNFNNAEIERLTRLIENLRSGGSAPAGRPGQDRDAEDDEAEDDREGRNPRDGAPNDGRDPRDQRRDREGRASADWPAIPDSWQAQGMGGRGGGGRDQGQDDEADRQRRAEERRRRNIANAEEKISRLEARNDEIEEVLEEEYGINPEGQSLTDPFAQVFQEDVLALTAEECDEVTLWSHDISAEPGKTYRYRMRAWLTNPFYGKASSLGDDQKEFATNPATATPYSDWTSPVTIDLDAYFFVVAAQQAQYEGIVSRPRATAELFEYHYGYWRRASVRLSPGDPLAGMAELPELPTFEIEDLGGGQYGATQLEEPLPTERMIAVTRAFLLSVAGIPGRERSQAYLRDAMGDLVVRVPRSDRESGLYRRLSESALTGLTAEVLMPGSGARRASSLPETTRDGDRPRDRGPIGTPPPMPGDRDDGFTDPGQF